MTDKISIRNIIIIPLASIGRVKNIEKLPSDKSIEKSKGIFEQGPQNKS